MSVPPEQVTPEQVTPVKPAPAKTSAEKLEDIIKAFETANKTDKTNPGQVLRDLMASSPALKKQLEDAAGKGELTEIKGLPPGTNAGGQFYGTTMEIPVDSLNKAGKDKAEANEIVFTLGHETRHGLNNPDEKKALEKFEKDLGDIAKVKGGKHDYTKPVGEYIQHYRDNEASANLSGWNTMASKLTKEKGSAPTLQEMYDANPFRMKDFIERGGKSPDFTYAMKPGLTADKDMQMALDPANIKAMGGYYFDKPLSQGSLGTNGNQNYPNYYGDLALNRVQSWEKAYNDHYAKSDPKHKPAEVQVDMGALGLSKAVLTTGLAYTDTTPAKKPIELPQGAHAEPAIHDQALKAVSGVQAQLGLSDAEVRNVAASAALLSQKANMERIDGGLISKNGELIVYQGKADSEHVDRVVVDVAKAKLQPAETTLAALAPDAAPEKSQPVQQRGINM